jgi:gliding motility-associated protein GldM
MSIPKEPRQLMINLMYLVLTALLAINVSSEILNAFKIINKSINRSNDNIATKNTGTITNLEDALKEKKVMDDPIKKAKITEALTRANQVRVLTATLIEQINGYSKEIIAKSGGYNKELDKNGDSVLKAESNLDAATDVMVLKEKRGATMKQALQKYKADIIALAKNGSKDSTTQQIVLSDSALSATLPINFDYGTKNNEGTDDQWAYYNFHMVPTIGAKTIMDKYVNDVRNSENIVLDQIWTQAFGEKVIPKKIPPVIVWTTDYAFINSPESNYLLPGEKYKSKIMIGTFNRSNTQAIYIAVNGSPKTPKDGVADFEMTADSKPGEHVVKITGTIYDPNKKTNVAVAPLEVKYYVGTPAASISLDKMNVFYLGVPNPVTVTASGIPLENLQVSPTGNINMVKGANGEYTVTVTGAPGSTGSIGLSGKRSDGIVQSFGSKPYRIKKIPDPVMKYMGKTGGPLRVDLAKIGLQLEAILENFDFDAKYDVMDYTLTLVISGEETPYAIKGPYMKYSAAAIAAMKQLKKKDQMIFEDIYVMGPDKIRRKMSQIQFRMIN